MLNGTQPATDQASSRVVDELNRALHGLLASDPGAMLIGQDVLDPYGGAFKVTRGLSTRFPEQVLTTPISEAGLVGAGIGLALTGHTVVAEVMFADFLTLAFDQLVNLAAKLPSMYGSSLPLRLVVRAASGGYRGYGPTHSQSLQRHFLGVPGLDVYELSQFHPAGPLLAAALGTGRPGLLFEEKTLYSRASVTGPRHGPFGVRRLGPAGDDPVLLAPLVDARPDVLVVTAGGMAPLALEAARTVLLEREVLCHVLVLARLYPLPLEFIGPAVASAGRLVVLDQGAGDGGWADVVAAAVVRSGAVPPAGIATTTSRAGVVPAARHLERAHLIGVTDLVAALTGAGDRTAERGAAR